jgi:hypothetical protein
MFGKSIFLILSVIPFISLSTSVLLPWLLSQLFYFPIWSSFLSFSFMLNQFSHPHSSIHLPISYLHLRPSFLFLFICTFCLHSSPCILVWTKQCGIFPILMSNQRQKIVYSFCVSYNDAFCFPRLNRNCLLLVCRCFSSFVNKNEQISH